MKIKKLDHSSLYQLAHVLHKNYSCNVAGNAPKTLAASFP